MSFCFSVKIALLFKMKKIKKHFYRVDFKQSTHYSTKIRICIERKKEEMQQVFLSFGRSTFYGIQF